LQDISSKYNEKQQKLDAASGRFDEDYQKFISMRAEMYQND
jgi:hypothetical protein